MSQLIPAPCLSLYGVSVRTDGTLETVGIGSVDIAQAGALADHLIELAEAIRATGKRRESQIAK